MNEHIAEMAAQFDGFGETQGFICECSQIGCTAQIHVPLEVYAELRESPSAFLVRPGHEDADHQDVLARRPGYLIIRTRQEAGATATAASKEIEPE